MTLPISNHDVTRTYNHWLDGGLHSFAIDCCARNAVLAVRVYVKLQNARRLPPGCTRKDFVRKLEIAHIRWARAAA